MRKLMWIVVLFVLAVLAAPVAAQEETDLDRLLAGEVVELDWTVAEDGTNQARRVLADFFKYLVREEIVTEETLFGYFELVVLSGKEISTPIGMLKGVAASSLQWDGQERVLKIQASRYLPPSDRENTPVCRFSLGVDEGEIWRVEYSDCITAKAHREDAKVMPTMLVYRKGKFTVEFLPPTEG